MNVRGWPGFVVLGVAVIVAAWRLADPPPATSDGAIAAMTRRGEPIAPPDPIQVHAPGDLFPQPDRQVGGAVDLARMTAVPQSDPAPALSLQAVVGGLVTDPDGVPVAGAWVGLGSHVLQADESGAFQVTRRALLPVEVIAAVSPDLLCCGQLDVDCDAVSPIVLQLAPMGAIEGFVVRADGTPAAEVDVTARWMDAVTIESSMRSALMAARMRSRDGDPRRDMEVRAGRDGWYRVPVPQAATLQLVVANGEFPAEAVVAVAPPSNHRRLDIQLPQAAAIEGTVSLCPEGQDYGMAVLLILHQGMDVKRTISVRQGEPWRFDGLRGGTYWIWAYGQCAGSNGGEVEVEVAPAKTLRDVHIELFDPPMVCGVARRPDGAPAGGVRVTLGAVRAGARHIVSEATTDADGRYALEALSPGAYDLAVIADAGQPWRRELVTPTSRQPLHVDDIWLSE